MIEVYSRLTPEQALDGSMIEDDRLRTIHEAMLDLLVVIDAPHLGYDGVLKRGQLVVHREMADTFTNILDGLIEIRYPIERIEPIVKFRWSDAESMAANNTSVYRPSFIGDPRRNKVSEHTRGSAIDLNPEDNEIRHTDGSLEPVRRPNKPRNPATVIEANLAVISLFDRHGMEWGGHWPEEGHPDFVSVDTIKDCHHFERRDRNLPVPPGIWVSAA